jgi:hypothetical protein
MQDVRYGLPMAGPDPPRVSRWPRQPETGTVCGNHSRHHPRRRWEPIT